MVGSSSPGDPGHPRIKGPFGAVVALAGWAVVLLLALLSGQGGGVVWYAGGLLTCLVGLAVTIGRARTRREDTWQAALGAAGASLLGPLSVALLLIPAVRRSLREAPALLRGEEVEPFVRAPKQVAVARPRDPSLVLARGLGFAAVTLAFVTSVGVILVGGVIIGLGCQGCTGSDGEWLTDGLVLTFFVAVVGFVGMIVAGGRARLLAGVEAAAAAGMGVAIVCVALDGGDMHLDDSRLNASFLYWVFGLVAILFSLGAAMAAGRTKSLIYGD